LAPNVWDISVKTTGAAPAAGAAVAAGAAAVKAETCAVVATMIATDGGYWELFLVQQIWQREILLDDQVQNMLA
jgi:hypothetical protein